MQDLEATLGVSSVGLLQMNLESGLSSRTLKLDFPIAKY
jgi:hypothetical protein